MTNKKAQHMEQWCHNRPSQLEANSPRKQILKTVQFSETQFIAVTSHYKNNLKELKKNENGYARKECKQVQQQVQQQQDTQQQQDIQQQGEFPICEKDSGKTWCF